MNRILHRPLTVADLDNIERAVPEELKELARRAAAQFKSRHHKKPAGRKRHDPT